MTIEFKCPHCEKTLKTSDDKAGRQAKCPGCGEIIGVPLASADADPHQILDAEEMAGGAADEVPPIPEDEDATRPCPMCGEQIKAAAVRCRFCGEELETGAAAHKRRKGYGEMRPFPPGEVISETWRIYQEKWGIIVGTVLVAGVLNFAISGVAGVFQIIGETQKQQGGGDEVALMLLGVSVLIRIAGAVFSLYLSGGISIIFLKVAREQPVEFGELFSGGKYTWRMFLSSLVFGLLMFVGFIACIIPGIIVALMYAPFRFTLVDEDLPGIQCLTRAKELTDGNWGSLFIVYLFAFVAGASGILLCGVGLIFSLPYASLLYAVAYDRMTLQQPNGAAA